MKSSRELEYVNQEMSIMYTLDSPYIVKLYDHFETEKNIYLLLELVEGVSDSLVTQVELYSGVIQRKLHL